MAGGSTPLEFYQFRLSLHKTLLFVRLVSRRSCDFGCPEEGGDKQRWFSLLPTVAQWERCRSFCNQSAESNPTHCARRLESLNSELIGGASLTLRVASQEEEPSHGAEEHTIKYCAIKPVLPTYPSRCRIVDVCAVCAADRRRAGVNQDDTNPPALGAARQSRHRSCQRDDPAVFHAWPLVCFIRFDLRWRRIAGRSKCLV